MGREVTPLETVGAIADLRRLVAAARRQGATVGFVPTMGYLHAGHQALMRQARSECALVVASIFVNPLQFGPQEDFAAYPRDLERDSRLAAAAGVDILFTPSAAEMYPQGFSTFVTVEGLSGILCGAFRPGHFRGVATVVAKLLNIVHPDRAYFGQKDAQQLVIIRRLVRDLNIATEVVAVPTVREPDGLALSSRNVYLQPDERQAATALFRSLLAAEAAITAGERSGDNLTALMLRVMRSEPLVRPQYAAAVDPDTLQPLPSVRERVLLAVAAYVGRARLIDNLALALGPEGPRRITL